MKKNVVIIILVILLLGMGGYLVYDKVIDKDNDKKEELVESKDYDLEAAKKLVDAVIPKDDDASSYCTGFNNFFEMSTEDYKLLTVLTVLYEAYNEDKIGDVHYVDCNNTTNNICNKLQNMTDSYLSFDYDKVNEKYHSMFGSNSNIPKKDIKRGLSWYEYEKDTDSFIKIMPNAGCAGEYLPLLTIYKVESAKEKEKELVITLKALELELESFYYGDTYEYYYFSGNYTLEKESTEMTYKDYENIKKEILEKEEDFFGTYEMTFVKENGKYYYSNMIRVY